MEAIYPPSSYGTSNHIPLKHYFEKFNEALGSEIGVPQVEDNCSETEYLLAVKDLMGVDISHNDIVHLSKTCNIEQLTCEGEDTKTFPIKQPKNITRSTKLPSPFITTEANDLMVTKFQSYMETQKNSLCWAARKNYYNKLDFIIPNVATDLQPGSDFVISVLVYRPLAFRFFNSKNASDKLRFNHEIVILGRNTLEELRDAIVCSADFGLCKEVESTSSDLRPFAEAKRIYPSGFIFIDDVFYNDFRDPNSIDCSFPIIKWAKEKKIKGLQSKTMKNVTINSLRPRFGYPYLYMHQGDCEHLIIFADAKLMDSTNCLHSQSYPHVLRLNRNVNKMCFMCSVTFAKWICIGSDRLPQHKVFLCTDCCNAYNYIDGKKIGNFKLYPYYEKHVVI